MGDYIRFTKNGLRDYNWNGKTKQYEEKERDTYVPALQEECRIDEGITLKDIFAAVEKDELLKHFISMYSWCSKIDEFLREIKRPLVKEEHEKLYYLELSWEAKATIYKERYNLSPGFEKWVDFYAIGEPNQYTKNEDKEVCRYSVSYIPMYELAHLPVKLNTSFEILHCDENYTLTTLFKGEHTFSLLDVLDGIFDDISFHGGPEETANILEELKTMKDDYLNGKAKCIPMEDVFKDLDTTKEE